MTRSFWRAASIRKLINWNSCSTVHVFLCFMLCALICSVAHISDWLFVCALIVCSLVYVNQAAHVLSINKVKVHVAHTRLSNVGFRSWSQFLAISMQVMWVINLVVGCHYFPPGPQLTFQPLRGLLPFLLLGEQRHNGCEQFAYDSYPTASWLQFEPRPFCAWVQHANHSATKPPHAWY